MKISSRSKSRAQGQFTFTINVERDETCALPTGNYRAEMIGADAEKTSSERRKKHLLVSFMAVFFPIGEKYGEPHVFQMAVKSAQDAEAFVGFLGMIDTTWQEKVIPENIDSLNAILRAATECTFRAMVIATDPCERVVSFVGRMKSPTMQAASGMNGMQITARNVN